MRSRSDAHRQAGDSLSLYFPRPVASTHGSSRGALWENIKQKQKRCFSPARLARTHRTGRTHSLVLFSPPTSLFAHPLLDEIHTSACASLCARLAVVHALSTVRKLVTLLLQLAVAVASGGAGPPAAGGALGALVHGRVRQARCACQSCLVVQAATTHPRGG